MSRLTRQTEPKLISASSILILSGFLIGLTVGKAVAEDLSPYILSCGLAGFLAYIALEHVGTRREETEDQQEIEHVQSRLDRHVLSMSGTGFVLPPENKEEPGPLKPPSAAELRILDSLYEELTKSGEVNLASEKKELTEKALVQS